MSGADEVVGLVGRLRRAGLAVGVGTTLTFAEALEAIAGPDAPDARNTLAAPDAPALDRDGVYWAGRATLVHRPEDIDVYDREFRAWWEADPGRRAERTPAATMAISVGVEDETGIDADGGEPTEVQELAARWSAHETLRHKDFARCTDAELDEARRLMAALRLSGATRRSRRRRATRHRVADRHLDLRRTVRQAMVTDGEIVRRRWSAPGRSLRRLVLILDISGSMEPYARALVRFAHAAVASRAKVEVFVFGTTLTRLTRELAARDPDRALAQAGEVVNDWSGGTRLGECLKQFNDQWGVRGAARGANVVILSDGWDRGDPDVLVEQMTRLRRVAHRIAWVNPLKATDGFEPTARGMAAALPFVDRFVAGHNLEALEQLAEAISSSP